MAQQSISQLKQWFENGDYPTQGQFWDWLDSYFHKGETIGMDNVMGLVQALQGKADAGSTGGNSSLDVLLPAGTITWDAPAGVLIEKIWVIEPAIINLKIGLTNGGDEILSEQTLASAPKVVTIDQPFENAATIYFGGITANTKIKLYLR